jgi:acyl-CoA thioesterase-1
LPHDQRACAASEKLLRPKGPGRGVHACGARLGCTGPRPFLVTLQIFAGLIAASQSAPAQDPAHISAAEACLAANQSLSLGVPLSRSGARLKAGGPFRVVAIGSSSTTGLWVLDSAATYPEVMRRELMRLRPKSEVEVINSGRIGDTIPGNLARFERDVLHHNPDLVIWQLGTNDVAWGDRTEGLGAQVADGINTLRASGTDLILMDLQYSPFVLSSSRHSTMQAIITDAARQAHVGLFSRFELMRRSVDAGVSPRALVSWDRLHNSRDGYDCIGRALARAIHDAAG